MAASRVVGKERGSSVGAVVLLAVGVTSAGCGSSGKPALLGDYMDQGATADGPDAEAFDFDANTAPPGCNVGPEAGVCGCLDLPLLTDVPNLYFVLDRSGSMNDSNKWNTVRTVIGQVIVKLGPRANFGATIFPDPHGSDCAPGAEVLSLRPGDAPAGTYGPTANALLAGTSAVANGGTPTAATIVALTPKLRSFSGRTFAILATDGGPNCDTAYACNAASCIPNIENADPQCTPSGPVNCCDAAHYGVTNCLDATPTVNAVASLKTAGVPTYVVGVPGSGPYAALLDQIAQAGGTPRASSPFYYAVNTTDQAAFASALSQIAAKITATCTLPLGQQPAQPNEVNVYIDGAVVPQSGADGWSLDGMTVTLLGATCQKVLDGEVLDVRVIAGCPTVTQ